MDYYDAYGNPVMKPKSSSAALLPVLLVLLASAGGNYWLWKERAKASAEANSATAKLAALEAMQKEMTERLATLEGERASLIEAKDQAIKDVQAKALELAKLKDDVAGVAGTDDSEEKGDDKAKADEKAEKGKDAKADKKAEAKADAKKKEKEKEKKAKKKEAARKKESGASKSLEHEL